MVRHYERPYTPEELDRLQRWIEQSPPGRRVWALGCTESILVYFLGFSTALILGLYLEAVWQVPAGLSLTLIVVFALCFATIRVMNRIRRRRSEEQWSRAREELRRDLDDGRAQAIHATVRDALRVNLWEDFGWDWFLDAGDGEIIFLDGLVLDDLRFEAENFEDNESESMFDGRYEDFPNSEIEIVRTRSGRLIDVRRLGEYVETSREVDLDASKSPEFDLAYERLPSNGFVFRGTLATLQSDLARELETIAPRTQPER